MANNITIAGKLQGDGNEKKCGSCFPRTYIRTGTMHPLLNQH